MMEMNAGLAFISEDVAMVFIPIIIFSIPIIAILTHHQRKMAELMRKDQQENQPPVNAALYDQLSRISTQLDDVKNQLNQHSIAIDEMQSGRASSDSDVQERIQENQ